jgi:transmembrane sensor
VLGTTFGVRAYPTDRETRVAVFSGRVRVNQGRALDAGDVARVAADGRATVAHENVEGYRGWVQGELTFMDTPILTVVNDLSRWYDVDIRIATPALANDHFSASFRNASLEHVLHTLSVTLGARVERHGRLVILHRP